MAATFISASSPLSLSQKHQQWSNSHLKLSLLFFLKWSRREKKKDDLHEKVTTERKEIRNKAEEERYMKEERDKMALELYENWLVSRIT